METRRSAPMLLVRSRMNQPSPFHIIRIRDPFYRVGLRNSIAFPLTNSEIADLLKYTDHFRLHSLDSKFYIFLRIIQYTIQLIQQN